MKTARMMERLVPIEAVGRLIPVGVGPEGKGPMVHNWPKCPGFAAAALYERFPKARAVGVILHPLLCFDIDGRSAEEFILSTGRKPAGVTTWRINRTTDPYRYKLLFLPTAAQLEQLAGNQTSHSHQTRAKVTDENGNVLEKGEAEEIFCHPGRQVIVAGEHPKSGGYYFWPDGCGPEALAPPPADWWQRVVDVSQQSARNSIRYDRKKDVFGSDGWERIPECPICGRGPDDNPLCQLHRDGKTLRCFLGQTFSPPTNLVRGQLVAGTDWAFSRVSSSGWGEFLTFVKDEPNTHQMLRGWLRRGR